MIVLSRKKENCYENTILKIIPIHMHHETRKRAMELKIDNLMILQDAEILNL